jgi:DUF4097 and DUF4098 domain-containing protein YvlB
MGGVETGLGERTFEVGPAPDLRVDTFAGAVTVRAGSGGEIRVVATKRAPRTSDPERIEIQMVEQGNGLVVRAQNPRRLSNAAVNFEITAPPGTRLDAHSGSGSVQVNGLEGGVRVDTGSGSVTLRDLKGDVDAHTGSGSMEASKVEGSLVLDTGSGRVTIEDMVGDSKAHTGSGGIDVYGARGIGLFDTGSGSVEYEGSPVGECRFKTGSGSITLRLPADLDARVDLHTGSGSIDVAYPVDGQASRNDVQGVIGSGDGATIVAHTGTGSIQLISR